MGKGLYPNGRTRTEEGLKAEAKKAKTYDSDKYLKKLIKFAQSSYGLEYYKRKLGR